ncbi:hypothetical protein [Macrococcoides canis]|uniref:hypothetical protein n=1 Tax=Macrococcoides canis TaxID=1855823 RepID=UPI001060BB38|nr:hypothetical protein [Macrococcus canis]TDM23086.1 hypothetical protein ETI02_08110 [Macrococcus canis]WBF52847.1 hypothetical protein LL975_00390 [Macrococcus canis]
MRKELEISYRGLLFINGIDVKNKLAVNLFQQAYDELLLIYNLKKLNESKEKLSLSDFYREYFPDDVKLPEDYYRMVDNYRKLKPENIFDSTKRGNRRFEPVFVTNVEQARSLLAIKLNDTNLCFSQVTHDKLNELNKLLKKINSDNSVIAGIFGKNQPKLKYSEKLKYEDYVKLHKYFVSEIEKYGEGNLCFSLYTLEKDMKFLFFQRVLKCLHLYNKKLRDNRIHADKKREKVETLAYDLLNLFIIMDLPLLRNYVLDVLEIRIMKSKIFDVEREVKNHLLITLKAYGLLTEIFNEFHLKLQQTDFNKEIQHQNLSTLNRFMNPFYLVKNKDYTVSTEKTLTKVIVLMKDKLEN